MKKSFNIVQLQTILMSATVLKSCDGITDFQLANRINQLSLFANKGCDEYDEVAKLIEDRKASASDPEAAETEAYNQYLELNKRKFEIELPLIFESEFSGLQIAGSKKMPSKGPEGKPTDFNYRDAYFNLLNIGAFITKEEQGAVDNSPIVKNTLKKLNSQIKKINKA